MRALVATRMSGGKIWRAQNHKKRPVRLDGDAQVCKQNDREFGRRESITSEKRVNLSPASKSVMLGRDSNQE
jgi:hypothetical protein